MWRPLEIFLYDWWPLRQDWLRLGQLARMHVRIILPTASAASPGAEGVPTPSSGPAQKV